MSLFLRLIAGLCSLTLCQPVFGQDSNFVLDVQSQGSVPPFPGLYGCLHVYNSRVFKKDEADRCMKSLLATGYFEDGDISSSISGQRQFVKVRIKAPQLSLAELDFGSPPNESAALESWLELNLSALRTGSVYEPAAEGATTAGIEWFFVDHGYRVGVSRKLDLDYQNRRARLVYRIWHGPPIRNEPLPPPYDKPCEVYVGGLNRIGFDDSSPMPLIDRLTQLRPMGCFSEAQTAHDEAALRTSGLFRDINYEVTGSGKFRTVTMQGRGKPLSVERIEVEGFGLLASQELQVGELPLRKNEPYSRVMARKAEQRLAEIFAAPDREVRVWQDVASLSSGSVLVKFYVLVYEKDELVINGKKVDPASFPEARPCSQKEKPRRSPSALTNSSALSLKREPAFSVSSSLVSRSRGERPMTIILLGVNSVELQSSFTATSETSQSRSAETRTLKKAVG